MARRRLRVQSDNESCPVHMESQVARKGLVGQSPLPIAQLADTVRLVGGD